MSSLISTLTTGLSIIATMLQRKKGPQTLDPIATLCMITFRNFQDYDKAKPSVSDDHFYWYREVALQGARRAISIVGHDDLSYLKEPLTLLVSVWKPGKDNSLLKIARCAIQGLKKTPSAYVGQHVNVETTVLVYQQVLERWIAEAEQSTLDCSIEQPENTSFIEKIKRVWTQEKINLFYHLYENQGLSNLETFLSSQRELYIKELRSNDITPFIEETV